MPIRRLAITATLLVCWSISTSVPGNETSFTVQDLTKAIVSAASERESLELLAKHRKLLSRSLWESLLGEGDKMWLTDDYEKARQIFQVSMRVAQEISDSHGIARTINSLGVLHSLQGNYEAAYEHFKKSFEMCKPLGEKFCMGNALNNLGQLEERWGNYEKSLSYHERALKLRMETGHKDRVGASWINIGNVHYFRGDYDLALENYKNALRYFEELGDKWKEGAALNNISNCYHEYGNHRLALQYLKRSLAIREKINHKEGVAACLSNIGNIHFDQHNIELAFDYYERSLKIYKELNNSFDVALVTYNIAGVYAIKNEYDRALEWYRKSLEMREKIDSKDGIGASMGKIGEMMALKKDYDAALEYFRKSLRIRETIGEQSGETVTLINIAGVYNDQEDFRRALQFAERAVLVASKTGVPSHLWHAKTAAGKSYLGLRQLDQAQRYFEDAIAVIESMRPYVVGDEGEQQRFFEDKLAPYHELVDLLGEQNKKEEALRVAELAKARVLLDAISHNRMRISAAMTVDEQQAERELNRRLVSLNAQHHRLAQSKISDPNEVKSVEEELQKTRRQMEDFRTKVFAAHPELRIQRAEILTFQLKEADTIIRDSKTIVLNYFLTSKQLFLFILTSGPTDISLKIKTIDITNEELVRQIRQFRKTIADRDPGFRKQARDLYDLLIFPADSELNGRNTLILMPDSILWDLPFQTLLGADDRFLLEKHSISYAPSLTVLREMMKPQRKDSGTSNLLAFGNPNFMNDDAPSGEQNSLLQSVPETQNEVETLQILYGDSHSKIYVGAEAKEETLKSQAKNFSILHLATHGFLNDINPLYSTIVLAQTPTQTVEDGLLETWEILDLDCKADLVVLSACETARGKITTGEGLIGFSWAFFVAGSSTTVVSQWKVQSHSTTELMLAFHKNIKSGGTKAEAMQKAALNMLETQEFRHPFYWAAFIVVGNGT